MRSRAAPAVAWFLFPSLVEAWPPLKMRWNLSRFRRFADARSDMTNVRVYRSPAGFSLANIAVLTVLLAGGCSRQEPARERGAPPPPARAAPGRRAELAPPANLTDRLAREKFTGDLDAMLKRRVIRVLVVADRSS